MFQALVSISIIVLYYNIHHHHLLQRSSLVTDKLDILFFLHRAFHINLSRGDNSQTEDSDTVPVPKSTRSTAADPEGAEEERKEGKIERFLINEFCSCMDAGLCNKLCLRTNVCLSSKLGREM